MKLLKQIDALFRGGTGAGFTDGELLERFVQGRDETAEAAFAALVDRHGAMVLRICRQVLRNEHDAEEAAQATFFVLARRAGSIRRRDSVACWLHGVALRVAGRARLIAARRRARERRALAMMAPRAVEADVEMVEAHERWALLHEELGRLPESFRAALVLCDLEGSTQEQAAAQLRWPLGTVQSRLARGRAKLKARLQRRGVTLSAFAGAGHVAQQVSAPPAAWAEATVGMAVRFANKGGWQISGAASAAMAEDVLSGMIATKLKLVAGMILVGAVLVSGAAVWAIHEGKAAVPPEAIRAATKQAMPEGIQHQNVPAKPELVARIIRGMVRDEQGRPVAKAWIGGGVIRRPDEWEVVFPLDRVRQTAEPFRDDRGKAVPPDALGIFFELRDETGKWKPVDPRVIRRFQKSRAGDAIRKDPFATDVPPAIMAAVDKGQPVFEVLAKGRWEMAPDFGQPVPANRTDQEGHFRLDCQIAVQRAHELHFASPDFSRREIHVVRSDDPDEPVEITLRPVRLVRERVIIMPRDVPDDDIEWNVYGAPTVARRGENAGSSEDGAHWASGEVENVNPSTAPGQERQFEVSLPAGRYKVRFWSDMLLRTIDLVVPPGEGPLGLPDLQLEMLGWVKLLSKPAPEIEAVGLDERPVKLADYRGKVVVVAFWTSKDEAGLQTVARLRQVPARFKGQPVAILAVHDASLTRPEDLKKVLGPVGEPLPGEIPIRFLLDRPLNADRAGEHGTGRTAAAYEIWSGATTLVVDKNGRLASVIVASLLGTSTFAVGKNGELVRTFVADESDDEGHDHDGAHDSLIAALENTLGLPKSRPAHREAIAARSQPAWPPVARGKVVDRAGQPIAGATVTSFADARHKRAVTTGPAGEFAYNFQEGDRIWPITVEALGFDSRGFWLRLEAEAERDATSRFALIEPSGVIPDPLVLGPGVTVAGRIVRDGKPVAGASIGLDYVDRDDSPSLAGVPQAKTDERGAFRFAHMLPETDFWVYAKVGSLDDQGALIPGRVHTTEDGSTVDLGDLQARRGRTLAGRVVTSDGKPLPRGAALWVWYANVGGSVALELDDRGRFEWKSVPEGRVRLQVVFDRNPAAGSYRVSARNKCRDPLITNRLEGRLDHDITDLTILVEPDAEPEKEFRSFRGVDPALVADFNDAKAGPITGVPPRP